MIDSSGIEMMKKALFVSVLCLPMVGGNLFAATTILKFGFGADTAPDFEGLNGILSTVDDGDAATPGDQNTGLDFLGAFAGTPSIPVADASVSFDAITLSGGPTVMGSLVQQPTSGGNFKVWDDANTLLLSGTFGNGMLFGSLGGTATASLISLDFGTFDGGTLQNQLDPNSLALSLSFTGVNDGAGFSVSQNMIDDFTTDATGLIAATIPEPGSISMLAAGLVGLIGFTRHGSRGATPKA